MATQDIRVVPPELLQAAASAAGTASQAGAPQPGVVPVAVPGSPADAAALTVATGMSVKAAEISGRMAGKGPRVQAATQQGVTQMQGQDEQNGTEIDQLAPGAQQSGARMLAPGVYRGDLPEGPTPPISV
jgi:hypothetical protein